MIKCDECNDEFDDLEDVCYLDDDTSCDSPLCYGCYLKKGGE